MPCMPRATHRSAAAELARRDPVLAELIAAVGPPVLRPPLEWHFAALVRSITYQQLAGAAYGIATPTPKELGAFGEPFRPYRSVAAWYCWRAVERARNRTATAVTG